MSGNVWTQEEHNEAFKAFGDFALKISTIHHAHGDVSVDNATKGYDELMRWLDTQPVERVEAILIYVDYIVRMKDDLEFLLQRYLARRVSR